MNFFEDLGKKISKAGDEVFQKTKDFSESTKIKNNISNLISERDGLYQQLGKEYYLYHIKNSDEVAKEKLDITVEKIKEIGSMIHNYEQDLLKINNITLCTGCGRELAEEEVFCIKCGTKVPEEEIVEVTVEETEIVETPAESATINCPNCNQELSDDSVFCFSCGEKITE